MSEDDQKPVMVTVHRLGDVVDTIEIGGAVTAADVQKILESAGYAAAAIRPPVEGDPFWRVSAIRQGEAS